MEFFIVANPIHIPAVFAEGGIKNTIYKTLQSGQPAQEATWVIGWGGITMTPIDSGGKPPLGQDFNGVLNYMTANIVHTQNGKKYLWSQDVVDNYGGYSLGSIVQSDDTLREFRSLANANTTNPNNGLGTTWEIYSGQGSIPVATSTTAGITRVLNTLTSSDTGAALSAAQGSVLNGRTQQADIGNVGIARFASLIEVQNRSTLPIAIRPNDAGIIADAKAFGIGQLRQNLTGSRALGVTYTNNTAKPIEVYVLTRNTFNGVSSEQSTFFVNGVGFPFEGGGLDVGGAFKSASITMTVQPNETYRVISNSSGTLIVWSELR